MVPNRTEEAVKRRFAAVPPPPPPLSGSRKLRRAARLGVLFDALESRLLMAGNSPDYQFALLASFTGKAKTDNGAAPQGLIMDSAGNLFGVTAFGGSQGLGTIFEIPAGTNTIETKASFGLDQGVFGSSGLVPSGSLALWLDPGTGLTHLYGTATSGGGTSANPSGRGPGSGRGVIWDWVVGSDTVNALAFFTGDNGANPLNGLIVDPATGTLYGTASASVGQNKNVPTVWKLAHNSSTIEVLATFTKEQRLSGGLVLDSQGNLFGTTQHGGLNQRGTIFEIAANTTVAQTIAVFSATGTGTSPNGTLLLTENAGVETIYGTTLSGGRNNGGTLFRLDHAENGSGAILTTIASFGGGTNGTRPFGTLVMDSAGDLIGVTAGGGNGGGTAFKASNVANGSSATITVLHTFNNQKGGLNPTWPVVLDGDGDIFGAVFRGGANNTGAIWELSPTSNTQTAVQIVATQQPANAAAGATLTPIAFSLEDLQGNVVTSGSGNLTLQIESGPDGATLGGTTTVAAVNGVATFGDITIDKAGTYTLSATDGTRTSAVTLKFVITAGAATQLAFVQQPADQLVNGTLAPIQVAVEDAFGNVVTTSNQKITLTATGPGNLAGTRTVSASGGIATFQALKIDQAGSYTLTAVDGSTGADGPLTNATSDAFDISSTQINFVGSVKNTTADKALGTIKVNVLDAQGHVLAGFNGNVTLDIASGPAGAALTGTTTVAAVNGVATFTGIGISKAGTYTLKASNGTALDGVSQAFTISAGAAAGLQFVQQPTDAFVLSPLSPAIQVAVVDQFGNVIANDISTVTLAIASGPGGATLLHTAPVNADGVRTFRDVRLDTAGVYTLQVTDNGLPVLVSDPFTVT